jgi:hypothetical protein
MRQGVTSIDVIKRIRGPPEVVEKRVQYLGNRTTDERTETNLSEGERQPVVSDCPDERSEFSRYALRRLSSTQ